MKFYNRYRPAVFSNDLKEASLSRSCDVIISRTLLKSFHILVSSTRIARFDRFALSLSALCLAHCLLLPVVALLFPLLNAWFGSEDMFHRILVWVIFPSSLWALGMGCRLHGQYRLLALGGLGITLLAVAAFGLHDYAMIERLVTVFGTSLLACAHWLNYRACRHAECTHAH